MEKMTPDPPCYEQLKWPPRNEFIVFSKGNQKNNSLFS